MKLFRYTVRFHPEDYDIWKDKIDENGLITESGVIGGPSYGDVVNLVADFYGEMYIDEISIYELMNPLCDDELKDMVNE